MLHLDGARAFDPEHQDRALDPVPFAARQPLALSSRRFGQTTLSGMVNWASSAPTMVGHSLKSDVVAKPRARAEGSSARAA